jgi:hypothetical protein
MFGIAAALSDWKNEPSGNDDTPSVLNEPSGTPLVRADDERTLTLGLTRDEFVHTVKTACATNDKTVLALSLVTKDETPVNSEQLLEAVGGSVPESLIRSVRDPYAIGCVRDGNTEPFIVLRMTNYDASFGGMLLWEPTLGHDLGALFGKTTAQSPSNSVGGARTHSFIDTPHQSFIVRTLVDTESTLNLTYAIAHDEYVVIAPSAVTLTRVLERLVP